MIYTVTFNPCLDLIYDVDEISLGKLNRTKGENLTVGGKGINVSLVLNTLGVKNTALGFIAGFTGDEIERRLKEKGIKTDFCRIQNGLSRINVKIKTQAETEINASGPVIDKMAAQEIFLKLENAKTDDFLVISGSIPNGISEPFLISFINFAKEKGMKTVIDSCYENLYTLIKHKPFLIKPNVFELEQLFGIKIHSKTEAIPYLEKLLELGAENVLASFGGDGAMLFSKDERYTSEGYKGTAQNTVGAGDSMLAGFLSEIKNGKKAAFETALACGSASAFSQDLATSAEISKLLEQNIEICCI